MTTGDETVTAFNIVVEDGQLVELTLTGYVTRTDANNSGAQEGFVYLRGIARRNDADASFAGLAVLAEDTTLQSNPVGGLGTLPAGVSTQLSTFTDAGVANLRVEVGSTVGTWFWDLELHVCVRDQIVDTVVA